MNLPRFLLSRVLQGVAVVVIAGSLAFLLVRFAPGSPFTSERAADAGFEEREEAKYGLDGPLHVQFFRYWGSILQGDFKESLSMKGWSVVEVIAQGLPVSMMVGLPALALALAIGVGAGSFAAVHHNTWRDRGAMLAALVGICLPGFVLAPILVLFFALWLPIFPAAGWGGTPNLVLPVLCLAVPYGAYAARLMRTSMLETLHSDFIRTARAKGLSNGAVYGRHALKVAVLPLLSFSGPLAAHVLTGSLVIERIFKIPGMGPYFVDGVINRDVFLVAGVVVVYCVLLVGFNLVVDILYTVLDRRIRIS